MIKLEADKMQRAIARAKLLRPRVKWLGGRDYSVTSSNGQGTYTVRFAVVNGLKLGECDCKAGQAGMMCFHICAAAAVNIAVQSIHRAAERSLALAA